MSKDFANKCGQLIDLHQKARRIHPALDGLYPIAIVQDERFYVYDIDQEERQYTFRKDLPLLMPIPQGIRAAFPLDDYGGRMACVVTPNVFETPEGYVTILHEFVHCYQFETCEQEMKMSLDVARKAQEVGDFMWEIEHPFPYQALDFIRPYQKFLSAALENSMEDVRHTRQELKNYLGLHDFEYMVWQEWKEGFARWIENRVNQKLGMQDNRKGLEQPYSRVLFYAGGEVYINFLALQDESIASDLSLLFQTMLSIV